MDTISTIEIVRRARGDDGDITRYSIVDELHQEKAGQAVHEQIEHVCGGCGKIYKNLTCLKKHFLICGKPTKTKRSRTSPDAQEENAVVSSVGKKQKTKGKVKEIAPDATTTSIELIEVGDEKSKAGHFHIQILKDVDEESCHCCDEPLSKAHKGHVQCLHCRKKFHTYVGREKHLMTLHSSCELYKCSKCPAKCPDVATLERHLVDHPKFVCMKCSKEFTRLYHLDRHVEKSECSLDNPDKQKTSCKVCGKKFLRLDNLREHLRNHIGANLRKRDHVCETCGKGFYGLSMLQIHVRSHTNERPFTCDLCEKSFPSNGALRKHRRVHTGEKPYACKHCEGKYAAKETLNRHLRTHTGEKNHKCDICDKAFIQKTQLRNHMRIYHAYKGIQCPHCSETFEKNILFKRHVDKVHKLAQRCTECNVVFPTEEGLNRHHELKHSNLIFFCEDCCMNFGSKVALYEHNTNQHSFPKRPTCGICGRIYKMQATLQQHMEREHDNMDLLKGHHLASPNTGSVEKKPSPSKNKNLFNDRWDFASFTQNLPLKIAKIEYSSEEELNRTLADIISGMLNQETHQRINWPTCGVESALANLLKLVRVPRIHQGHESTLRNSTITLLGRFIGKRSLSNMKNNYTVDEIIYYWASSVSKISSGVANES